MTYDVSGPPNSVRNVKNAAGDDGGVQPRLAEKSTLDGTPRCHATCSKSPTWTLLSQWNGRPGATQNINALCTLLAVFSSSLARDVAPFPSFDRHRCIGAEP